MQLSTSGYVFQKKALFFSAALKISVQFLIFAESKISLILPLFGQIKVF
jgi:hypothetical protein